jgi:hypothetical protein
MDLYIENPAITAPPTIPPMAIGANAAADSGRNDRKIIQNFLNLFIKFNHWSIVINK